MECGQKVMLSKLAWEFNVTNGEILFNGDLAQPSYFVNGSSVFAQENKIYGLGFGKGKPNQKHLFLSGDL